MNADLMPYDDGQRGRAGRRREVARPTRRQRAAVERAEISFYELVQSGRFEETKAMLRKRLTEDAIQDVTDVWNLTRELAEGDQYIASLLIPIVQEYARASARDIRDFGRGRGRS